MYAIVTTVGRSLLDNFRRSSGSDNVDHDRLVNFLKTADMAAASAETNSLSRLLKKYSDAKLQFIHSDTEEGRLCSKALARHFESQGHSVETIQVNDLKYEASRFKHLGLRQLVNQLARVIENNSRQDLRTIINATGGFKAEVAYATLVALMYHEHVEATYYIYEGFRDIVELPALPISLDVKHWKQYEDLFEWLAEPRPREEVERRRIPAEVAFLTSEDSGHVSLSPAGLLFYLGYLEAKEIRERSIQEKERLTIAGTDPAKVKVTSGETTVWLKKGIATIQDIPEKEVRDLLKRIIAFEEVERLELHDFHKPGKSFEVHMSLKELDRAHSKLRYDLYCEAGKQSVDVIVKPGTLDDVLFMLGRKIYP